MRRAATFSGPNMRETLSRDWDASLPMMVFIGCNPGKANGSIDDATARKYVGFAQRWGCGRYVAGNLWQWVATDQKELVARVLNMPVNPPSPDDWLNRIDRDRVLAVCYAWGRTPPKIRQQWHRRVEQVGAAVQATGFSVVVAARNKDCSPSHLSRLPYTPAPIWISPTVDERGGQV